MLTQEQSFETKQWLRLDDLIGHQVTCVPGEELVVGRSGTFPVGEDDEYMHRRLVHIWHGGAGWLIRNCGRSIPVTITSIDTDTRAVGSAYVQQEIGPGGHTTLPTGKLSVVFTTSQRTYELHIVVAGQAPNPGQNYWGSDATKTRGNLLLNDDQKRLLKILVRPLIANPGADDSVIPTVAKIADETGWTEKAVNRRIETLVAAIQREGGPKLQPRYTVALARHALKTGLHR